MSRAPWGETSHLAAAVIVTRAHCCLTATGHSYVMLGTIKVVEKSVNDNSARRLDHCDVIASRSGFGVPTGVPHSEVKLQTEFKSFTAAHSGSNKNQHTDWTLGGTCIKSSRSVYAPHLVQSVRLLLFKCRWGDNAHWIFKNKMAATAVPSGTGRMITSKPSLRSSFDCIIRPAPSGAGRTTPSQPGHHPLTKFIRGLGH